MGKKKKKSKPVLFFRSFYIALAVLAVFITTYVTVINKKNPSTLLTHAYSNSTTVYNKNVYVIIFNPILLNNQTVVSYMRYNDPNKLITDYINQFKKITNNRVNYTVAYTSQANYIPVKVDGFQYTPQQYAAVLTGAAPRHDPDTADYYQFINDSSYDICGKVNKGQVDEVWLMGGPWMGFHESTMLAGPGSRRGFPYNSEPKNNTTCNKLIPVMGFNYEVGIDQMLHSFGHRVESTMN
jgi:FlaG/FlaF family flagellin (archaellin)